MCLPIGSFYFCFLYKKQGYIFLHLGSARNKQTNIRNHGGKKTRGKHWRIREAPCPSSHSAIQLFISTPLSREHHVLDDLKHLQGLSWMEKRGLEVYRGRKQSLGKGNCPVSCHGGLNRNAEQAKDCPNSRPPLQGQSKCARMGHSPPRSHLTDWLTPWARKTISGWLLYTY